MEFPKLPTNENKRLARLRAFKILDTPAEDGFDDLIRIAAGIFEVPIALVSLVDENRQWFKAKLGLDATETPRDISFCGHAVASATTLVVNDTSKDERFVDNPLVTDDPNIGFYAGAPLITGEGEAMGTLCVIDRNARQPSAEQIEALEALARQVVSRMELRLHLLQSKQAIAAERLARKRIERQAECLHRLQIIAAQYNASTNERIDLMIDAGLDLLGLHLGLVAQVKRGRLAIRNWVAATDSPRPPLDKMCDGLWQWMGEKVDPEKVAATADARVLAAQFGLNSPIAVPLVLDGEPTGILLFASPQDVQPLTIDDHTVAEVIADGISAELSRHRVRRTIREEALRERVKSQFGSSEDRFFDTTHEILAVCGFDGYFRELNPAAEQLLGYSLPELMSRPFYEFLHPDDRDQAQSVTSDAMVAGSRTVVENRFARKEGGYRWLLWSLAADPENQCVYGIAQDIGDRKRIEKMKNEFVSTVSHELRTPLTSIRGSLGLLLGGAVGDIPGEAMSLVKMACNNTDRLVRLINDMLDVDKIESGKLQINRLPVDLRKVAEHSIAANATFARDHGVEYCLTEAPKDAWVRGDQDRLIQVLDNLLSNAAKYARDTGKVNVSIEHDKDDWRLCVTDHGPGIDAAFQSQLFQRFSQADSSTSKSSGGTGLGLNISKGIVEMHGGTMGVDSTAGSGATFWCKLPKIAEQPETKPKAAGTATQILVVEDNPDIAHLIELMLAKKGIRCDLAPTAVEAASKLLTNRYSAVTLDIGLPDEDGINLFRRMRARLKERMPPVIVVSATADKGKRELAGNALGIVQWIQKPIDLDLLQNAVLDAAKRRTDRVRVLHVEDDAGVLEITRRQIEKVADVTPARTVQEARLELRKNEFDLAIIDIGLPDGDGGQIMHEIHSSPAPVPVIIYSGNEIEQSLAEMAEAVLIKTKHDQQDLLTTIGKLLDQVTPRDMDSMP